MRPVIWMFSGQGAQYFGMGRDLYAQEPVFRRAVDLCSEIVAPLIDVSLSEVIYRDRQDRFAPFDRVLYTNPAICAVQYGVASWLTSLGHRPDALLGYSLGCVTAEVVSEALSLEDGLRVAVRLAELSETALPEGGMLAVLAAPESLEGVWTAAYNFPSHFVVAGQTASLAAVEQRLRSRDVTCQRLPVRHAFHCPLVDPIQVPLTEFVAARQTQTPSVTVIGRRGLWEVIRQPVDFQATVQDLESRGPRDYVDCGPAGTLATFVKYNLHPASQSETYATVTPFDRARQNLAKLPSPVDAWERP